MPNIVPLNNKLQHGLSTRALDPTYFLPDERSFSDFLKFINLLSKQIRFRNLENIPEGDWYDFFISDEIFLLAEIENFPLEEVEKKRINILISFENQNSAAGKLSLIQELFNINIQLLKTLNDWYVLSSRFNKNRNSTKLEAELNGAIEFTGVGYYQKLRAIAKGTFHTDGKSFFSLDENDFIGLWKKIQTEQSEDLFASIKNSDPLNYALKQLMLILKPVYKTISLLIVRANGLLKNSLENNASHQPHIGLMLTFLQLYKNVQDDINKIPARQLKFYFEDVLGQKKRTRIPDRMLCYFGINEVNESIYIPEGAIVLAGQNAEGYDKKYRIERETVLNRAELKDIKTLFVSRNPLVDQNTKFQMVSGIYSNENISAKGNNTSWSSLGEEQRFLTEEERTMQNAEIGFALSSPTLRLHSGEREVNITFHFTESSFHYLTTVLIDISNKRKIKPDEVFYSVFSDSISLEYTGPEGWEKINEFRFAPPVQWDMKQFTLQFTLGKSAPAFSFYDEEVHMGGLKHQYPTLRINLIGSNAYHPYSHLHFLDLEEIQIDVKVQELKNLFLYSNNGLLDGSGPFDLLGATPKKGSFLLIGNEEIFAKKLDSLQIGWEYYGLPTDERGISGYFSGYPYGIENDSFKLRISALSDHRFYPKETEPGQVVDLFTTESETQAVAKHRFIDNIDLSLLKIRNKPELRVEEFENFNNKMESGFIKLELVSPSIGFGYDVFSQVYNQTLTRSADMRLAKSAPEIKLEFPRDPFAPKANGIFVNYTASTSLIFSGSRAFKNEPNSNNTFTHIWPFGKQVVFNDGKANSKKLVPYFEMEGSLFIGLDKVNAKETIHLLFELERNAKWSYGKGPEIQWSYLTNNTWKKFKPENILFDETSGLINSGIISIELPVDISNENEILPSGLYWIAAAANQKAELVSRIRNIYPNAASAKYIVNENDPDHPVSLPANSAQSLEIDIPGILSVHQPLPTIEGRLEEDQMEFNLRVSEMLRHKNRAITNWDIEKMLLRKFDWLSVVKSFGHLGYESHVRPGQIVVAALPKINPSSVFYQPLLNPGEVQKIENYIKEIATPFADITVRNPTYEYIWIKCKVRLNSKEIGTTLKLLYKDLLEYLCPWFNGHPETAMDGHIVKRSDILDFIQNRPYVSFVTAFSVIHMQIDDNGKYQMKDSAKAGEDADDIIFGNPWSILVPFQHNDIEVIDTNTYFPPESTSLEDLVIGTNLIVGGDFSEKEKREKIRNLIPQEKQDEQNDFWFTLKI
jgi:hypothetical protein